MEVARGTFEGFKEYYDAAKKGYVKDRDAEELELENYLARKLEESVNWLILNLYRVDEDHPCVVDDLRLKLYGLEGKAINWGDLSCKKVERIDGKFVICVEELGPNNENFKRYVEYYLKKWGWKDFEIVCEW